jgi:hypothetical protein
VENEIASISLTSDFSTEDTYNQYLDQLINAKAVDIKKADENVQENVGVVGNVMSAIARGAVRNVSDLPKYAGLLTGSETLQNIGVGIDEAVNAVAPLDAKYKDSFWATTIPEGLGQVLGMAAISLPGALARGAGKAGLVGAATIGAKVGQKAAAAAEAAEGAASLADKTRLLTQAALQSDKAKKLKDFFTSGSTYLMGGSEGYDAYVRSIEQGDSALTAAAKSLGYATIASAIEAKMMDRVLGRVTGMFGKEAAGEMVSETGNAVLKAGWKDFLKKDIGSEIWAGFKEEAQQALAQDIIVSGKIDPTSLLQEGAAGGVIQGIVGGITGIKTPFRKVVDNLNNNNAPNTAVEVAKDNAKNVGLESDAAQDRADKLAAKINAAAGTAEENVEVSQTPPTKTPEVGGQPVAGSTPTETLSGTPAPAPEATPTPEVEGRPVAGLDQPFFTDNRIMVLSEVNGVKIPFYLSTGTGRKTNVPAGKWYPFFGVGEDGWLNKGSEEDVNNFYGSAELKAKAEELNAKIGDIRDKKPLEDGGVPVGWDGKSPIADWLKPLSVITPNINEGFSPVSRQANSPEAKQQFQANIANTVARIKRASASASTPTPTVTTAAPVTPSTAAETQVSEEAVAPAVVSEGAPTPAAATKAPSTPKKRAAAVPPAPTVAKAEAPAVVEGATPTVESLRTQLDSVRQRASDAEMIGDTEESEKLREQERNIANQLDVAEKQTNGKGITPEGEAFLNDVLKTYKTYDLTDAEAAPEVWEESAEFWVPVANANGIEADVTTPIRDVIKALLAKREGAAAPAPATKAQESAVKKVEEKESAKQKKDAEKEAAKQQKAAEKEAAKQKKEEERQQKAAEREAAKQQKAAAKQQRDLEKAAKAAEREAVRRQKAADKASKAEDNGIAVTVNDPVPPSGKPENLAAYEGFILRLIEGSKDEAQYDSNSFSALTPSEQALKFEGVVNKAKVSGIIPSITELAATLKANKVVIKKIYADLKAEYERQYPPAPIPEGQKVTQKQFQNNGFTRIKMIGEEPYFDNTVTSAAKAIDLGLELTVPLGVTPHPNIIIDKDRNVVRVFHPTYGSIRQPGDYAKARANDPAVIRETLRREDARLEATHEAYFKDTVKNEIVPRFAELSDEAKIVIYSSIKQADGKVLANRKAKLEKQIAKLTTQLESPFSALEADALNEQLNAAKAQLSSLEDLIQRDIFNAPELLNYVDPDTLYDTLTNPALQKKQLPAEDIAKIRDIAKVFAERTELIEEGLFPTINSNLNSKVQQFLQEQFRKEGKSNTVGIVVSIGDLTDPNHVLLSRTIESFFGSPGAYKVPAPEGDILVNVRDLETARNRWLDYLTSVSNELLQKRPEIQTWNSFLKSAEGKRNALVKQLFEKAQVAKQDLLIGAAYMNTDFLLTVYPNVNRDTTLDIVSDKLRKSLREYQPASASSVMRYGSFKMAMKAVTDIQRSKLGRMQESALSLESLEETGDALLVEGIRNGSIKATSTTKSLRGAMDAFIDDTLKTTKVSVRKGKVILDANSPIDLWDVVNATSVNIREDVTVSKEEYGILKRFALNAKRTVEKDLATRAAAAPILREQNEASLFFVLEEGYKDTPSIDLPKTESGDVKPFESLTFAELAKLSLKYKYSKTKVTNVIRRAVDRSILEAKAAELGVRGLLQYGTPIAGIQAYYDPSSDAIVLNTENIDGTQMAIRKLYHELTERNLVYLNATKAGKAELQTIFNGAKNELMASIPVVLKESGYANVQELMDDYGFATEEELLGELTARYAERIADKPKPSWWQTLMAKLRLWMSKHFGSHISGETLEHWLAGNIKRFAASSPSAEVREGTLSEKLQRIDERFKQVVDAGNQDMQRIMVDAAANTAGLVGPLWHSGTYDPASGEALTKPLHLGTRQAAAERSVGKPADDEIALVQAYQTEDNEWHWDDGRGTTSESLDEGGYATEEEALASGRNFVYNDLNFDELYNDDTNISRLFIDAKKVKRVEDVGGANGEWDAEIEKAKQEGYDAISYINRYEDRGSVSYLVWDTPQVRNGELVTYDDAGNLIPLSARFNLDNPYPRFSKEKADEERSEYEERLDQLQLKVEQGEINSAMDRFEVAPETMVSSELNSPNHFWTAARSVAITSDNAFSREIYNLINKLNMQQLRKVNLPSLQIQLEKGLPTETVFDPAQNLIRISADAGMSYDEMSDAIMRSGLQAALYNAASNGLPTIAGKSGGSDQRVTEAVQKLTRALKASGSGLSLQDFALQAFDPAFIDRMHMTHPPGNPSENVGRMIMDSLYTLLGVDPAKGTAEEVARLMGSSAEAQRFAEYKVNEAARFGGTKPTTAAKSILGNTPEVDAALKGSTYFNEYEKENVDNANAWVANFNGDLDGAWLALKSNSTEANKLTTREQIVAYAIVAQKFADLSAIAKKNNEPYAAQDLMRQSIAVRRDLETIGSAAGQELQIFATLKRMFNGSYIRAAIIDPIVQTVGKAVGGEVVVKGIEAARATVSEAAATSTAAKTQQLIKAIAGGKVDQNTDQLVFDFFNAVYDPTKLNDKLIGEIAKRLVDSTITRLTGGVAKPQVDSLRQNLYKSVAQQFNALISVERAKVDPNLESILVDNLDLAERSFEAAKEQLLASKTLTPEQAASVQAAKFSSFDYNKTQKILKKHLDIAKLVRSSLANQNATLGSLITELINKAGLSKATAAEVANALTAVYNVEAKKEARKQIDRIVNAQPNTAKVKITDFEKLVQFFNIGAFDTEEYWNAVAKQNPKLNLPTYDPAFVKQLMEDADAVAAMPDSLVKQERIVKLMTRVAEMHSKNLKGFKQKIAYWGGNVLPSVWTAGILSGVPTQMVNLVATKLNVLLQSGFQALGYGYATYKQTGDVSKALGYFKDVIASYQTLASVLDKTNSLNVVSRQALEVGKNRFAMMTGQPLSVLESLKSPILQGHKWVGRFMSSADAFNTQLAYEINQRLAFRYASIQDPSLLKEGLASFNPNAATQGAIEAQLNSEGLKGRDRDLRRVELTEQYRKELVNDEQFLTNTLSTSMEWTMNSQPKGFIGLIFAGTAEFLRKQTGGASQMLLPFMTTVSNLTNSLLDFTPVGIARALGFRASRMLEGRYKAETPAVGTPEYHALWARAIVGNAALMLLGSLAAMFFDDEKKGKTPYFAIYGAGPTNPNDRKQWEAAGWLPFSVRVGDLSIPYRDMPGFSLVLGALGSIFDTARFTRNPDKKTAAEMSMFMALGVVSTLFEKNLLSGVSNLFEVISNPDARGLAAFQNMAGSWVGGVTNPRLVDYFTSLLFRRDENNDLMKMDRSTAGSWFASVVPVVGPLINNKPALNVLGDPITEAKLEPITRRFVDIFGDPHPIIAPLVRAGMTIPAPSKSTQFAVNGQKYTMSDSENAYRRFVELRGDRLKQVLTPAVIENLVRIAQQSGVDKAQKKLGDITENCRDSAVLRLRQEIASNKLSLK